MSRYRKSIALITISALTISITLAILYRQPQSRIAGSTTLKDFALRDRLVSHSSKQAASSKLSGAPTSPYRLAFRQARDYYRFVEEIKRATNAGDPIAEYLTAKALRYCADNLKMFVAPDDTRKTLDEVQIRLARIPGGFERSNEVYGHCHTYLDSAVLLKSTGEWGKWLDLAVAASYPPAKTEKADVLRVADLMHDATDAMSGDVIPPTAGPAKSLALEAVLSGDPDSILGMANWVDGTKRTSEESYRLTSAWEILACRRGYDDCGTNSEFLRSICTFDAQCANDATVVDSLRRQLGERFDDVDRLASEIGAAVDSRNLTAIESFL